MCLSRFVPLSFLKKKHDIHSISHKHSLRLSKMNYSSKRTFDRQQKRLQKDRIASLEDGKDFDFLRDEIARRLVDRLDDISSAKFESILELGAHAGQASKYIDERNDVKLYIQSDISDKILKRDDNIEEERKASKVKPIRVVLDEEELPFANETFDLVFSNLALHWVNDIPKSFKEIQRVLKADGVFIASMLGGNTLSELKSSMALAEEEREGGLRPHASPLAGVSDVGNLLTQTGYNLTTIDQDTLTVKYKDAFSLMTDLQNMGENNALSVKKQHLSRETLLATAAIYKEMYGDEQGDIPATFQVIYLIGWKPHPNQPKPKRRGSGTHKFTGEAIKKEETDKKDETN